MIVTALKAQVRDKSRVNVYIDGVYSLSLDVTQVAELGVHKDKEYTESELQELIDESAYGKLYTRSLEYALTRPRSVREMKDYLYKKTRSTRTKEGAIKPGVSVSITERVLERLIEKGYVDDEKFTAFWVENRNQRKGTSFRKLQNELRAKGVSQVIIEQHLSNTERNEKDELRKVVHKKAARYDDEQKLIAYLMRQGFRYDDIKEILVEED